MLGIEEANLLGEDSTLHRDTDDLRYPLDRNPLG